MSDRAGREPHWGRRLGLLVLATVIGLYGWPFYQQYRLWNDPRFNISQLRGLTPDEVIQRLGSPSNDDRRRLSGATQPGWRDDDPSDPLILAYDRGAGTVAVDFLQNHAFQVRKFAR